MSRVSLTSDSVASFYVMGTLLAARVYIELVPAWHDGVAEICDMVYRSVLWPYHLPKMLVYGV